MLDSAVNKIGSSNSIVTNEVESLATEQLNLDKAYQQFNRLSQHFFSSYRYLEKRVTRLSDQLADANTIKIEHDEAYQRLASRYEHLLNIMPVAIIVLDGRGIISEANQQAAAMLNTDLIGKAWISLVKTEFRPKMADGHEVSLRDGRLVKIETRSLEPQPGQIIVLSDLTETRQLQSSLSRHQRLSMVGKMMASLSHQVRTPLASALIYASHLQDELLPPNTRQLFQKKIIERLNTIERQIQSMLKFIRGESLRLSQVPPAALFAQLEEQLEHYRNQVTVNYQVDSFKNDRHLLVAVDDFLGALTNLCDNAVYAMQNTKKKILTIAVTEKNDAVLIEISDNGVGIPEDNIARIFEPFYTTSNQGTGLGLAVVNTVIRQHQADLSVRSKPNMGTKFSITLPLYVMPIPHDNLTQKAGETE